MLMFCKLLLITDSDWNSNDKLFTLPGQNKDFIESGAESNLLDIFCRHFL